MEKLFIQQLLSVFINRPEFMKLKLLIPFIVLLFSTTLCGQNVNMDSIFEPRLCGTVYEMAVGYKGSQFYNNEWANADILLSNEENISNKLLRYNGFIDEVIWKNNTEQVDVKLEKHFINEFVFKNYNGKSIRFKRILVKLPGIADSTEIFVEVLAESKSSCYVFRKIMVKGYDLKVVNGLTYISDNLAAQPQYYLVLPDKEIILFRHISKRSILKALPEKYMESAKSLIQKNHLSLRSEDNLKIFTEMME
jgi:hypothetical protein